MENIGCLFCFKGFYIRNRVYLISKFIYQFLLTFNKQVINKIFKQNIFCLKV